MTMLFLYLRGRRFLRPEGTKCIFGQGTKSGTETGNGLRNLGLDLDVVAHEMGHMVVFETLRDARPSTETLVVHEGLADALANQHAGDPCVAESVCPNGSGFCQVPRMCLRLSLIHISEPTRPY